VYDFLFVIIELFSLALTVETLQAENSMRTLRPTRIQQCTHGIMSESATRSTAQNSAYTAQNSTKVAQNSRCFRPVKIPWEHLDPLDPQECHGVHMAYMSESSIRGVAQNTAYMAQNSTKVVQNSQCFRSLKIPWEH